MEKIGSLPRSMVKLKLSDAAILGGASRLMLT
jgi:hypothetical protein